MERLRLRTIPWRRISNFLLATFVLSATTFCWGTVSWADQGSHPTKPDPFAGKRAADAKKARSQRDAAVKRRVESKKYLQQVIESQRNGTATAAPGTDGTGGAK
jgi:hypothetical protein